MALSGNWKNARVVQSGALKQGTGVNKVHAIAADADGRDIAPNLGSTYADLIPLDIQGIPPEFGYTDEDATSTIWGYGPATGLDDRPRMDTRTEEWRTNSTLLTEDRQPEWGHDPAGLPAGTTVRKHSHGSLISRLVKARQTAPAAPEWIDKAKDGVNDPTLPDPSQLIMQTSMMQRDRTRAGSQSDGRADEHTSPVPSRVIGMRTKPGFSGAPYRHYDMAPLQAEEKIRPWWSRTAGSADPVLLQPNEQQPVTPVVRNPPPDPWQGEDVGGTNTTALGDTYGYVGEDVIPYA